MQKAAQIVGFGLLVLVIIFLVWHLAVARMEIKALKIEVDFHKAKCDRMEKLTNQALGAVAYYQAIMRQGIILPEDAAVSLKKGTLIIPPEALQPPKEK